MVQIEAARLVIRMENRFEYVRNLCRDYITSDDRPADITVSVTEEELRREIEKAPECFFGDGYAEGVVLYEKIHRPGGGQVDMVQLIELVDRMVTTVPVYRLRCRNDISAAETAIAYFGL